tara:strand:- start:13872 stop:14558 length:687 start_codon:yes stop_codon:yes gene_type:complete
MKSYAIVMSKNKISTGGFTNLQASSKSVNNEFETIAYDAITEPSFWSRQAWDYPWEGEVIDMKSGLTKSAYPTRNPANRIACAESHYNLWVMCLDAMEPFLIQEHDSIWKKKLDATLFDNKEFDIIGINNPIGSTRRSNIYHHKVQSVPGVASVVRAPKIDKPNIPQGIAGNSAYIISPNGAKKMISLIGQFGLWPNDAIMCRQLVPRLGQTRIYYTGVQALPSTTTE